MDFAAMKRRELQALCKRHGLAGGGSNADLVARLAATLSGCGGAEEQAVGAVVGKGCLKRSAGGASGGGSDAAKKVTFVLEEEEEAEAEVGVRGRRRRRPVVAKTRGRRKAGEALADVELIRGERRRTRAQVGGDSAAEFDGGEAGADAPARWSRRNVANLVANDGVERVAGVVSRNNSAKAEEEVEDVGEAVDRKQKRKTRENDVEDVHLSAQVGVSRRSTRSSGLLSGPAAVLSPVVAKVEISGRTTRSSSVAAAVMSPTVCENKRRRKREDVHSDRELPAVPEMPTNAAPVTRILRNRIVQVNNNVVEETQLDKKLENERQPSRPSTRSHRHHHLASSIEEKSQEQVTAPCKGPPLRRSRRNHPETDELLLNNNTSSESSNWSRAPIEGNDLKISRSSTLSAAKDGVEHGVAKADEGVEFKKRKPRNGRNKVAISGSDIPFSDSSGKASAIEMQTELLKPVRGLKRKSVVPSFLEHGTKGKQPTVKEPVRRSARTSVVPAILEKERNGLSTETIPEIHVRRPTRKSTVPAMLEEVRTGLTTEMIPEARVRRSMWKSALPMVNNENNGHGEIVRSEDVEKQPTVKQPIRRITRKSAVPAMLEKERKGIPAEMNPHAHVIVRRSMRKSVLPNMLNNENSDHFEMQSAKGGDVEKQLGVKEPVKRLTHKSVVPAVFEKETKGLHEEMKSEVSVRKLVHKSLAPTVVVKENKDCNEMVRREESSVQTRIRREESSVQIRNSQTRLQLAVQNGESLRRTTRNSSKLMISPLQSKPTASKGRSAKRRRTTVLQEDMSVEEHKEDQIAYGTRTSGALPFPAKEKPDLRDAQLNSKLEGAIVVDFGHSCEDVNNNLEFGSAVNTVSKRTPSNSSLPEDSSMDHYQQQELLSGLLVDKSSDESAMCLENGDLGAGGSAEKPLFDLAIPEHVGALSKEAVHSVKNYAGRCSPNISQSPIGLQFLFSQGNTEVSDTHNAIPSSENKVDESDIHKAEWQVEKSVSLAPDSYHGSHEDLIRLEENGVSSQQNNEQEGFSKSSQAKDSVASAQLDSSEDVSHVVRKIITEDVICKEKEKHEFVSGISEPAEHVSGVSEDLFCNSQSTPIFDEVNLSSNYSQLESMHVLDNHILFSNTEVLHWDNKEEWNVHTKGQIIQGIDASGISEAAPLEGSESGKKLLLAVETSESPDVQFDSKLEGDEFEEHTRSCDKDSFDICGTASVKNNMSHLVKEYLMDSCQEQELKLPNDLSALQSHEESAICQDKSVIGSGICGTIGQRCMDEISTMDHEERNEHNEDQVTPGIFSSGMSEPAAVKQSESGMTLPPTAETSTLPDEQLNAKLEGKEEHSLSCDKDTTYISDNGSGVSNILSSLKDSCVDPCHDQELPNDMPAPKSPEESAVCLDGNVSGSLGICQTSGRRRVDEISTKLLSFKISSTVKGSYIAMDAPHSATEGDNLSQSALPRNSENTPAAETDSSVSKDSSTRALQSISRKPGDVGLAADNSDSKLDMKQVQQDDVQVQEGTLEKTALGSATPECKHECGLPDEEEVFSMKNEGYSPSVEQSPFGLQSLFSQESIEEPMEYCALALAGVQAENGVGESKDYHEEDRVEKTPLPEPVSDHETHVDFSGVSKNRYSVYASQQDNEKEGLTKASHEQEQVGSGQLEFLEAANCMKGNTNSEEVAYEDEKNKKPVHFTDINSSCEKLDANRPVEHASGVSDALLSSSLIAATDDNDKVHDEPIGCSSTEVLQQGLREQCDERTEDQVACGACTRDMIEGDTAKGLESGVSPLPADARPNLQDEQLNSKLECTEVVEFGLSCDKYASNILEFGSVVNSVGQSTPSDTTSRKDLSMDHYLQQEPLKDFSVEKSPEESGMCWEKSDPRAAAATFEKPSFDLAIRNCKHEGVLSEKALYPVKNDAERCSPDLKQSPIGRQFLFLRETMDGSDTHDAPVLLSAENIDDSNTFHVDLLVEKVVSSEPDSYQGSDKDLTRIEENGGLMFSSELVDEQEGFSNSNHRKDWAASSQLDVNHVEREIITEEVICGEEEDREFIPFSDIGTGHEQSHASEPAERASGVSEASFYHKEECNEHNDQVTPGVDASGMSEAAPIESSESGLMPLSASETLALPEEQLMMLLPAAATSALPDEQLIMLLPAVEMSTLPDEQPNPELEGDEFEESNLRFDKDASDICGAGSVNNTSHLHEDRCMDPIQEQELRNDLSAPKSPKESAICQGIFHAVGRRCTDEISTKLRQDHKEECNEHNEGEVPPGILASGTPRPSLIEGSESGRTLLPTAETSALPDGQLNPELEGDKFEEHNRSSDKDTSYMFGAGSVKNNISHQDHKEEYIEHNEDQVTPGVLAGGKSEPALIEGSESVMTRLPAAETSVLPDRQINPKLEGNEEHSLSFDKDTSNISDTGLVENNNLSSLPKDACSETCQEQDHPVHVPAPRSPEESAICPDDSVPGSVGICQSSGRRRIEEISTKLLTSKISSTVKGSCIATDARSSKQGDNQSQSAVALLRNREKAPATRKDQLPNWAP